MNLSRLRQGDDGRASEATMGLDRAAGLSPVPKPWQIEAMEIARIERRIGVRATPVQIWDLIADLPGWDRWNPVETGLEGTIAFGAGIELTEQIEGLPERRAATRVGDWQPYSQLVWAESRGLWFRTLRYFEIEQLDQPNSCIVANGFIFSGLRGEMYFDKHRRHLRQAVDAVADAWKAAAEA